MYFLDPWSKPIHLTLTFSNLFVCQSIDHIVHIIVSSFCLVIKNTQVTIIAHEKSSCATNVYISVI